MAKPWRPTLDDVDSISRGGPARVRGTGSRYIPHRLNAEERNLYDLAKKKSFLTVRGTGYRKFRHGNPLPNIFRQWCDARAQLCVVVEQDKEGHSGADRLVVDLAPLRLEDTGQVEALLCALAAEMGVRRVGYEERPGEALPFNILPPEENWQYGNGHDYHSAAGSEGSDGGGGGDVITHHRLFGAGEEEGASGAGLGAGLGPGSAAAAMAAAAAEAAGGGGGAGGAVDEAEVAALRRAVEAQAAEVRRLKETEGRGNADEVVQQQVQVLLRLKAELQSAVQGVPRRRQQLQALASCSGGAADSNHAAQPAAVDPAAAATTAAGDAASTSPPSPSAAAADQEAGSTAAAREAEAHSEGQPPLAASPDDASPGDEGLPLPSPASSPFPSPPRRSPLSHYYTLPIWQIHAVPLFFEAERPLAKAFAAAAVKRVGESLQAVSARR